MNFYRFLRLSVISTFVLFLLSILLFGYLVLFPYYLIWTVAAGFYFAFKKYESGPERKSIILIAFMLLAPAALVLLASGSPTYKGNFEEATNQLLQKATQNPLAVFPFYSVAKFSEGETYSSSIFETAANGQRVVFESNLCGDTKFYVCYINENDTFIVNSNFNADLFVCCTASSGGTCKIGIGKQVSC